MNREFRIAIAVLGLLGATGCQGVLDVTPKDQFPDAAVFADPNLAQAFLNDAYRGLGHGLYEIMLASMTDETHFYHNLMRMYGGVPLITKVYGLNEDYKVARNSFKETVDFIVANADSAAALLPLSFSGTDVGRATKGAALALKARVLLYAASDLYNLNPSDSAFTGYTTPQDRVALWRAAKNAAKAVMDLGIYGLFRPSPASPQEAAQNYGDLFLQRMSEEVILSRFFLSTRDNDGYNPGLHNGPNGFHTWGGNTPIQNLVDD